MVQLPTRTTCDDVLYIKPNSIFYNEPRSESTTCVSSLLLSKLNTIYLDLKMLVNFSKVSNKIVYVLNLSGRKSRYLLNRVELSAWIVFIVRKEG